MVRSAAAVLAVLILPGFALAQQASGSHAVVDGDTLWDLAQTYYGDPFDWRRIWEANRAQIDDPNLILPGQTLVIPGTTADVTEVVVETPAAEPTAPASGSVRTIFYSDTSVMRAGVVRAADVQYTSVPRDLVYSAPWLTGFEGDPEHTGVLDGSAGGRNRGATVRSYERVRVTMDGAARVGDQLQVFEVGRVIEDVGRVVLPTGLITVSELVDGGVIGVVTREYRRIVPGQFIGPLPGYDLSPGQYAEAVSSDAAAMVMGFASTATLRNLGHVAFLDVGAADGITLGDEFTLYNPSDPDDVEGSLQVVGVTDGIAAARIVHISDAVFEQGVVVRLTKKMR